MNLSVRGRPGYNPLWVITGLTVLALVLRLYHLTFNSIWLDEAFTWFYIQNGWSQIFWMTPTDSHPPLFYWITKLFLLPGSSDFMLRLFPALIGAATIPVFYLIGKEVGDPETGLWMAAFLTVSQFHTAYSQEARMYTLWLFLFAIGFLFFLRKQYGWFALFSGLCLWTQFLSFINYVILWLVQERDWLKSLAVYIVVTFPLVWFAITIFSGKTGVAPEWGWPGPVLVSEGLRELMGYSWWLLAVYLFMIVLGVLWLWHKNRSLFFTLAMFFVGTSVIMMVLSYYLPMTPRYLTPLLVPLFLTAALSVKCERAMRYLAVLAILISCFGLSVYYTTPVKDDWRAIPCIIGDAPVAVVGPEFVPAFERYHEYHSLPLRYYCPSCNIVDPWNATYLIQVNELDYVLPGKMVYEGGGLRVYLCKAGS